MKIMESEHIISAIESESDGKLIIQFGSKDSVRNISYYPKIGRIFSSLRGAIDNIDSPFDIDENEQILIKTREKFKLRNNQIAICFSRVQNLCEGLVMNSTFIDPGYEGHLHLSLRNISNRKIRINQDDKSLAKIVFFEVDGINISADKSQAETIAQIIERIQERISDRIQKDEKKRKNRSIIYFFGFILLFAMTILVLIYAAKSGDGNVLQTGILQAIATLLSGFFGALCALYVSKNKKG